jgi:hypothetical protein
MSANTRERTVTDLELQCIPAPAEKAKLPYLPTAAEKATFPNIPSAAEKAGLVNLPTAGEKAGLVNLPTAGEKAGLVNLPTAGEKAGLVNLPSAGEKAALPNIPAAADTAFLARLQSTVQVCLPIYENADADEIVAAALWADGAYVLVRQPDVPRNITINLTDVDNSCTGTVTVTGSDPQGRVVTEVMTPDGLGGGKVLVGTKIFARVVSVVVAGAAGAAPGDNLEVGVGLKFGVPFDLTAGAEVVHAYIEGIRQAAPTIVTGVSLSGIVLAADPGVLPGFLLMFIKTA